ncbi:MAG: hypothetical protein R2699_12500 [Acidimicrobiales bacterium]
MAGHEQGRDVVVVPHTHWDREWYKPYQLFRMQLVELVDQLLDLLEGDPSYAHFQLDGQMAVVDDYLEIRPEARDRIEALATAGRLSMGPWYILPDEFLVSGETLVRDLQLGLRTATAFGGAMDVGYLPDMFGHVAQMPQLLRLAGFGHTVVWRGVPSAVDRSAFWWSAPDGSTVRAEYLLDGYGNGAHLPTDAKDLVAAIDRFCDRFDAFLLDDQPLLWMNGTDHLLPQPWLGRVVAEANGIDDDRHLRVGSLADYLAVAPTEGLASWTGELRSGARANLLMGVASNRIDVKQAAARVERGLERLAEPLATLHLPADAWPGPFLDVAWREVVRNSAHDSICACSHDDVGLAVLHRFAEAGQIADGITERAIAAAGAAMAEPGTVVLNPSARPRRGVVELRLPGREPVEGTQLLGHRGGEIVSDGITRANAAILVQTALDAMPELASSTAEIDDDGVLDVRLERGDGGGARGVGTPVRDVVLGAAAEDPDAPARLTVVTPEMQKVLAWTGEVPGYGWTTWAPHRSTWRRWRRRSTTTAPCTSATASPRSTSTRRPARSPERHDRARPPRRRRRHGRHVQLQPAGRRRRRRRARRRDGAGARARPAAGARRHRPALHLADPRRRRRPAGRGCGRHHDDARGAGRLTPGAGERVARQPGARPSAAGLVPAARGGRPLAGRVRLRRRVPPDRRRGRTDRAAAGDVPVPTVRVRRRADGHARGPARVRAGRARRRRPGACAGPDAAALHRADLAAADALPAAARRTDDADARRPDARPPGAALRRRRRRGRYRR